MKELRKNSGKFIFIVFFVLSFSLLFAERFQLSKPKKSSSLQESGLVTAVYDGDTIKVRFNNGQERRVRLIGIDSPETDDPQEKKRFQAYMAKRFAFFYLYQRPVKLSYEEGDIEDKYGRLLAYVWTEKQGLFNKFILSEGFAYAYLNFPFRYRREFIAIEEEARKLEKGFWQKGRYPSISASETRSHIGSLISVKFICLRVEAKGKFVFLHYSQEDFSALIPQENISLFPEIKSLEGQELSVTGFLEEYKGKPEIVVFFPRQIKVLRLSGTKTLMLCPSINSARTILSAKCPSTRYHNQFFFSSAQSGKPFTAFLGN